MKLQESITGFYYVGSNRSNITKFVKIYKRGYASGDLDQAMAELTREGCQIPEVICCESSFGFHSIRKWSEKISRMEKLAHVPLIVDEGNMSTAEQFQFMHSRAVDDLLNIGEWEISNLSTKLRFLQKYKARTPDLTEPVQDLTAQIPATLQLILKRIFDIVVSSVALFFLSPVFLLIAVVVRLESRGPVFYISKRAGKGYRIFNFYKFRTMIPGADKKIKEYAHLNQYQDSEVARFFKLKDDPRITRVGRFLRNSSLDELPQLINVLLGDMSLVGNRPLPLYEAESLTTDRHARRFLAPAGITGLWQIKKRGKSEMSEDERIGLDIDYADQSNLLMDMWIMAQTPQALLQKANT